MTDLRAIECYLKDLMGYPPYYSMKRDYILEYSWEHWSCSEILTRLRIYKDEDPLNVMRGFNEEMKKFIDCSKTSRSKCLFTTALAVGRDVEGFLQASRKE